MSYLQNGQAGIVLTQSQQSLCLQSNFNKIVSSFKQIGH